MEENTIRLKYKVTGDERKRLVKAIAECKETFSEYCGAPTFAYTVDEITIDKEGTVTFGEAPKAKELKKLITFLSDRGFTLSDESEAVEEEIAADDMDPEDLPHTISMPREGFTDEAILNLKKIIDSKATLLKKSLGIDDLTIEITDDKINFPWFKEMDSEAVWVYMRLIGAICEAAKNAKRVTATDHEVESEKYAFRTWLLRLGFIGAEYKKDREILMKNLSGTAAFKNEADAKAFMEKQKAKKAAKKVETQEDTDDEISE